MECLEIGGIVEQALDVSQANELAWIADGAIGERHGDRDDEWVGDEREQEQHHGRNQQIAEHLLVVERPLEPAKGSARPRSVLRPEVDSRRAR